MQYNDYNEASLHQNDFLMTLRFLYIKTKGHVEWI